MLRALISLAVFAGAAPRGQIERRDWPRRCSRNGRAVSELETEPRSRAGYAHVVAADIGVRNVVEQRRHADPRHQLITKLGAFPEQDARAEQFAVGRPRIDVAVMHRAAEAAIDKDAVAGTEEALDQHDAPGQPEIAVAGFSGGVDIGADMRPRRADRRQQMGRGDNTAAERDRRIAVPEVQHTPDWRGLCSGSAGLNQTRWSRCGWFSGPISTRALSCGESTASRARSMPF